MSRVFGQIGLALLLVVGMAAFPGAVLSADVVAMADGGGRADFLDTPHSVTTSGFTNFSVAVTVYSDGTAHGHFVCQVPGVVVISGDFMAGSLNDDGSITAS